MYQIKNIGVDILVGGKPIRQYSDNGKIYVESRYSTEYTIRIKNEGSYNYGWYRCLAVVSVDGINVLDGTVAGTTKAGYVITGNWPLEIKGFRTSNETVHPFKFSSKSQSYAAKSEATQGDTQNCGVIGVEIYSEDYTTPHLVYHNASTTTWRVFDEELKKTSAPQRFDYIEYTCNSTTSKTSDNNNLVTCCVGDAPSQVCRGFDTGTEFSKTAVTDKVRDVEFKVGRVLEVHSIYYASRQGLLFMGVPCYNEAKVAFPNAFPGKFCKPPTW